jgi:Flp pilus assembly protein TadD
MGRRVQDQHIGPLPDPRWPVASPLSVKLSTQDGAALRVVCARAWRLLGEHDRAIAELDEVLAEHPGRRDALVARIDVLREAGRFAEAVEAASEAANGDSRSTRLRTAYARALVDAGRYDDGLVQLRAVLAVAPRHLDALSWQIMALRNSGAAWADSVEAARLAQKVRPEDPEILVCTAWCFQNAGRDDEALTHVRQALTLSPESRWAIHSELGPSRETPTPCRNWSTGRPGSTEA